MGKMLGGIVIVGLHNGHLTHHKELGLLEKLRHYSVKGSY